MKKIISLLTALALMVGLNVKTQIQLEIWWDMQKIMML